MLTAMCLESYGQISATKALPADRASLNIMRALHNQQIEQGKQYSYFYPSIKGHQFWGIGIQARGTLTFEGVTYQDILLKYDIYNDQVVMTIIRNGLSTNITLDNSRIDMFQIEGETFVNIRRENENAPEFYRLVFNKNHAQLYAKVKKVAVGNNRLGQQLKKFVTETVYLLVIDGEWNQIESKKDLLKVFAANSEITAFIQVTKLKFRRDEQKEASILKVLREL